MSRSSSSSSSANARRQEVAPYPVSSNRANIRNAGRANRGRGRARSSLGRTARPIINPAKRTVQEWLSNVDMSGGDATFKQQLVGALIALLNQVVSTSNNKTQYVCYRLILTRKCSHQAHAQTPSRRKTQYFTQLRYVLISHIEPVHSVYLDVCHANPPSRFFRRRSHLPSVPKSVGA